MTSKNVQQSGHLFVHTLTDICLCTLELEIEKNSSTDTRRYVQIVLSSLLHAKAPMLLYRVLMDVRGRQLRASTGLTAISWICLRNLAWASLVFKIITRHCSRLSCTQTTHGMLHLFREFSLHHHALVLYNTAHTIFVE